MNTNVFVQEWPARIAHGGQPLSYDQANIDADLAACSDSLAPHAALVNLTVNYACTESSDPATWKANMGYIVDAIHTKWPSTSIYIARMWNADNATQVCLDYIDDTLIPDVISTRAYCHLGIDERLLLPGGDNGATYTVDGTHPNAAGNALIAASWLQVLGY